MKCTGKELTPGKVETNTLNNLKIVNHTDKGLTRTEMEQNTWGNLKIVNITDKEL